MSLKKWICPASNIIDLLQFLCCVHLLHKAGMSNQEVLCRIQATTAKKCTRARCIWRVVVFPLFFRRSRCFQFCHCLSSLMLWSRNSARNLLPRWCDITLLLSTEREFSLVQDSMRLQVHINGKVSNAQNSYSKIKYQYRNLSIFFSDNYPSGS